jgi:hypothetical protein
LTSGQHPPRGAGFDLVDDIAMPANNRIRLWQRRR